MTVVRAAVRQALAETRSGDEFDAALLLVGRLHAEPAFAHALVTELAPRLEALAPTISRGVAQALLEAGGDDARVEWLLRERNDPRENPAFTARVAKEASEAVVLVLLDLIREERSVSGDDSGLSRGTAQDGGG